MKVKDVLKEYDLREVKVEMGMFDYSVICIVGDYKNVQSYARWKFEDKDWSYDVSELRGCCLYRVGFIPVIWIPKKPRTPREYATFAHECLHAVYHLFAWVGLAMNRETEEVATHAMSHLITNILKQL